MFISISTSLMLLCNLSYTFCSEAQCRSSNYGTQDCGRYCILQWEVYDYIPSDVIVDNKVTKYKDDVLSFLHTGM